MPGQPGHPAAPPVCSAGRQELCHAAGAGSSSQALLLPALLGAVFRSERCLPTRYVVYLHPRGLQACTESQQCCSDGKLLSSPRVGVDVGLGTPKLMVLKKEEAMSCLLPSLNFH